MPRPKRRRLRLFWPYGHHLGLFHHPAPFYGPPPAWGWGQPSRDEEMEYLNEYIEVLKDELAAAEEYRKELESSD